MFIMMIEQQMNIKDRTLLLGIPDKYDSIPSEISVDTEKYKVVGVSMGCKAPYMSLEIETVGTKLIGKKAKG